MRRQRILVIDDEPKIRTLLRRCLEAESYTVSEASRSSEALEQIAQTSPDLITLDLQLGADNGLDLARSIRQVSDVPIIMVTGKGDVIDRVVGLEIGADDYIAKPFHVREVTARVKSVLRRSQPAGPGGAPEPVTEWHFDGLVARPDDLTLIGRDGAEIKLTSGDHTLLRAFLDRPPRLLSRDQLMEITGGARYAPLDRTIDNQVARLRKKIERDPTDPALIKTVRGIGYMFVGDTERR